MRTFSFSSSRRPVSSDAAQRGLNVIEMMASLTILAVLVGIALPSFKGLMGTLRARQALEDVRNSVNLARTEAIRRGGKVVMARQGSNSSGCTASTDQEWSCGWRVFVDTNRNGIADAGEQVLRFSDGAENVTIRAFPANPVKAITFDRWGQGNGVGAMRFFVVPKGVSLSQGTVLCVSAAGRIETHKGRTNCPS